MPLLKYRAERQASFLFRLNTVLTPTSTKNWHPTRLLLLGHGIAAVEDNLSECDIYFASSMWRLIDPNSWGDYPYPPRLENVGLGKIEGIGEISKVEDGLLFAMRILEPTIPGCDLIEKGHEIMEFPQRS